MGTNPKISPRNRLINREKQWTPNHHYRNFYILKRNCLVHSPSFEREMHTTIAMIMITILLDWQICVRVRCEESDQTWNWWSCSCWCADHLHRTQKKAATHKSLWRTHETRVKFQRKKHLRNRDYFGLTISRSRFLKSPSTNQKRINTIFGITSTH